MWLKTDTEIFSLEQLSRAHAQEGNAVHEQAAIDFCRQWLEGKETFVFQTSGSTGPAKQLTFSRNQLETSARNTQLALDLRTGYTSLVCLDVNLIAGAMMLVRSLVTGMNMILRKPAADPLLGVQDQIDFAAFVPYQVETIVNRDRRSLERIRKIIVGGAPLDPGTESALAELSCDVYATYGMTETVSHVALRKLSGKDRQESFRMLPGFSAELDPRGCLVIDAQPLGLGKVVTNDRVELLDRGAFLWLGRNDRVINSGGIKIQAEALETTIESVLSLLKMHRNFFVAGWPDQKLGEQVALVIEGGMRPHEEERLVEELQNKLPRHWVPKIIHLVPKFAQTPSMKTDRLETLRQLREK